MNSIRFSFDKVMRAGVKLAMLTGVAFTVAACYGPPPPEWEKTNPNYQADRQRLEQQLATQEPEQDETDK